MGNSEKQGIPWYSSSSQLFVELLILNIHSDITILQELLYHYVGVLPPYWQIIFQGDWI